MSVLLLIMKISQSKTEKLISYCKKIVSNELCSMWNILKFHYLTKSRPLCLFTGHVDEAPNQAFIRSSPFCFGADKFPRLSPVPVPIEKSWWTMGMGWWLGSNLTTQTPRPPVASRGWHISIPRNYLQCTTSVIVIMFFITNSLVITAWQFSCIFLIVLFQQVMATYIIKNLMKREATKQGILMGMQSGNIGSLGVMFVAWFNYIYTSTL